MKSGAALVAAGILLSRVFGLVRQRVFSHYLGLSAAADIFTAALRIPNLLQNLFGEGVLSASFIPVYSTLLAQGRHREADQLAGCVAAALALIVAVIVALGMVFTPQLLWLIAPGFEGEKRQLAIVLVRILFPGTGILALSAWCLGVLNSHGKFFLSYAAPVVWNCAIIATLIIFGTRAPESLIVYLGWGTVAGCVLQFAVQIGPTLKLLPELRLSLNTRSPEFRLVLASFIPVAIGRGVVQISAFVDQAIASFLGNGVLAAVTVAASVYILPISLFGMSISAAELPALSRLTGQDRNAERINRRFAEALGTLRYFVVPSTIALIFLGNVIVGALYQTGAFTERDTNFVWAILAGSSVGLLASTSGRLYASFYYATGDSRSPLRIALVRLFVSTVFGITAAIYGPKLLGVPKEWGAVALAIVGGSAAWLEMLLLRKGLRQKFGLQVEMRSANRKLWLVAALSGASGMAVQVGCHDWPVIPKAVVVLGTFGVMYLGLTYWMGIEAAARLWRRIF